MSAIVDINHDPSVAIRVCGCRRCLKYLSVQAQRWKAATNCGQDPIRISGVEARSIINYWQAAGFTIKALGRATGMDPEGMRVLLNDGGKLERRWMPAFWGLSAAGIIAAQPPTGMVPSLGAVRRLHALMWMGWSGPTLPLSRTITNGVSRAGRTGLPVMARTHRAVATVFNQLGLTEGPRIAHQRAYAKAHGWAPPLAWDPETMDDPGVGPDLGGEELTPVEQFVENTRELREAGVPAERVLGLLGVTPSVAAMRLRRQAPDLAAPFMALDDASRGRLPMAEQLTG